MNFDTTYAITRRLPATTIDSVRPRVVDALKAEGFGVLTEIDVKDTLKQKLGIDREPYVILGACNPQLANEAITNEPAIGLLLPCNVVLAQDGAEVVVSAASPRAMFRVVENAAAVAHVAEDAERRLRRAIESLSAGS